MLVSYQKMYSELLRVLLKVGFSRERAELSAKLFSDASLDGVYSHGLNRFPRYISDIRNGHIDIYAEPVKTETIGVLERWDGNQGPGNINAYICMENAIALAKKNGMGCIALKNTNHWMRPGAYGLQAADAGCIGICWTNTMPNMPPWGAKEPKIGNNPIVLSIPKEDGHILLDMALSMFSYGKLETYARNNETLPYDGGFNNKGQITKEPKEILDTYLALPIGYWKGSGFSLVLDLISMILSGGNTTCQIGKLKHESKVSQTFIAIDISKLSGQDYIIKSINDTIEDIHNALPITDGVKASYPGERMLATRIDNMKNGIPVVESIWQQVLDM